MVQIVVRTSKYLVYNNGVLVSTRLSQSFLRESERERLYDDRGDTLSVGKCKRKRLLNF